MDSLLEIPMGRGESRALVDRGTGFEKSASGFTKTEA